MELAQQVLTANELWPEVSIFSNLMKAKTVQAVLEIFVFKHLLTHMFAFMSAYHFLGESRNCQTSYSLWWS